MAATPAITTPLITVTSPAAASTTNDPLKHPDGRKVVIDSLTIAGRDSLATAHPELFAGQSITSMVAPTSSPSAVVTDPKQLGRERALLYEQIAKDQAELGKLEIRYNRSAGFPNLDRYRRPLAEAISELPQAGNSPEPNPQRDYAERQRYGVSLDDAQRTQLRLLGIKALQAVGTLDVRIQSAGTRIDARMTFTPTQRNAFARAGGDLGTVLFGSADVIDALARNKSTRPELSGNPHANFISAFEALNPNANLDTREKQQKAYEAFLASEKAVRDAHGKPPAIPHEAAVRLLTAISTDHQDVLKRAAIYEGQIDYILGLQRYVCDLAFQGTFKRQGYEALPNRRYPLAKEIADYMTTVTNQAIRKITREYEGIE